METSALKQPPSLVLCCQRVISANIDVIAGFGQDMPYRLVKPVLHACSPDTLARLEQGTPHIIECNQDLWRDHCLRGYPTIAAQYARGEYEEPLSWRDEFMLLRQEEAKRLEEAGNKIRNQRLEAEELKRKRQVQITDRHLPQKRLRGGWTSGPTPPKTLFQKTRAEATKIQKNVFGTRLATTPHTIKSTRIQLRPPTAQLTPSKSGTPKTVSTVKHRHIPTSSSKVTTPKFEAPASLSINKDSQPVKSPECNTGSISPNPLTSPKSHKPPSSTKDSLSSLFMPKHRAYSQLPKRGSTSHSVPAR